MGEGLSFASIVMTNPFGLYVALPFGLYVALRRSTYPLDQRPPIIGALSPDPGLSTSNANDGRLPKAVSSIGATAAPTCTQRRSTATDPEQ